MTTAESQNLSDALVAFSLEGRFPDEIAQIPPVSDTNLEPAIQALGKAREELEVTRHDGQQMHHLLTNPIVRASYHKRGNKGRCELLG